MAPKSTNLHTLWEVKLGLIYCKVKHKRDGNWNKLYIPLMDMYCFFFQMFSNTGFLIRFIYWSCIDNCVIPLLGKRQFL